MNGGSYAQNKLKNEMEAALEKSLLEDALLIENKRNE